MNVGTQDVGISISAAGTTQATATLLINGINWVTTVASGAGVRLFDANVGTSQTVYNAGANPLSVYPVTSAQINGLAVNAAHVLAVGTSCTYWVLSSVQVIAMPQAFMSVGTALSAAGTTQGTATALTSEVNGITTAAASSGVILYAGAAGYSQIVYNGGANPVKVYPPTGAQINALGTNNAQTLGTNTACTYYTLSTTLVIGVLSA